MHNGVLKEYLIVVRGVNTVQNTSKILTNVSIDVLTTSLLLTNLTEGVTYTVSVAAVSQVGIGPFSKPMIIRIDPITKRLDMSASQRFPINHSHDILTETWFIILLGVVLVIFMLSFGVMIFIKRKQMIMKQQALSSLRGNILIVLNSRDTLK